MIDNNSREALRDRWNYKILSLFFLNGVRKVCRNRKLLIIPGLYIIAAVVFWINREALGVGNISLPILGKIYDWCIASLLVITSIALFVVTLILLGKPKGAKVISDNLHRMGLVNHAGEAPVLISRSCKADNSRIIVLEFETDSRLERLESRIESLRDTIENLNPSRILEKGYSIIKDENDLCITEIGDLRSGKEIKIVMRGGDAGALITEVRKYNGKQGNVI